MVYFFADTSFLVALEYNKDNHHKEAIKILNKLYERKLINDYKDFYVTDYVIAEVFHTLQEKVNLQKALECYTKISQQCQIRKVSYPETIQKAINSKLMVFCNRKSGKPNMGLTDATSLVAMEESRIPYIISFDEHFVNIPLIHAINKKESIDVFPTVRAKKH